MDSKCKVRKNIPPLLFWFYDWFFIGKSFLHSLPCFISWPPTESGDTIWILTTQLATEISVFEMRPWFLPIFSIFFKSSFIFSIKRVPPHHINSTSLIFTCLLHLYLLLPSHLELSAYWGGRLKRRERQWWIMLLGFCFEELFLMLDCLVCYWFLLSMVVKTAVLKYCNHPSKRPGVRLAAGSVCIFVLNLSYFLWNSFRSNFTCIFGGYFFVL